MGYKIEQIEQLKKALTALPKARADPHTLTKIEVVRLLQKDIDKLRRKGYGLDAIAIILGQHGLRIGGKTLRNYLSRIRIDPPHAPDKMPLPAPPVASHHKTLARPPDGPRSAPGVPQAVPIKASPDGLRAPGGFALHPDTDDL